MDRTNKGLIIGVLVVLLGGYLFMRWTQDSPPAPPEPETAAATNAASDGASNAPTETAGETPSTPPAGKTEVKTTPNATTLQKTDLKVGTGKVAKKGDQLLMHYKGMLTDGTVFDESYKRGEPFPVTIGTGQVIKGWDEGIPGMKEGGKRKLVIPPDMGYGAQGAGGTIPPNATLIFEVELLKVG